MTSLKATVGHMVPNFCSGNPGAIAAWQAAAHVEKAPKEKGSTNAIDGKRKHYENVPNV